MPCYNCTSRVLRIFLQDSIASTILRPRLPQRRSSLLCRPTPTTRTQLPNLTRHQSTLVGGPSACMPSDDEYIPFDPPVTSIPAASEDGGISGRPPPPPSVMESYEPAVEIVKVANVQSAAREKEARERIEFIRRSIEEAWARRAATLKTGAETGLPVVGGKIDLSEMGRMGMLREQAEVESLVYRKSSDERGGKNGWRLSGKGKKGKKGKGKGKGEEESKFLDASERRKARRREEGRWKLTAKPEFENERRFTPKAELEKGEAKGEKKIETIAYGPSGVQVPLHPMSLPESKKPRIPSVQEFISDRKNPFDRERFAWQRAKVSRYSIGEGEEKLEPEPRRCLKKGWRLPATEKPGEYTGRNTPRPMSKLEHYVSSTPKSEIEAWKLQKLALRKKFGDGWKPRKKLSPRARRWVKELHKSVPELTTEKLSEIFRISPDAIRRILKSSWAPSPEEEMDMESRWLRRRDEVWKRWISMGVVQTKGMRADTLKDIAAKKEMWKAEQDEAYEKYREKVERAWKQVNAMQDGAKGRWAPLPRDFNLRARKITDVGTLMASEKHARDELERSKRVLERQKKHARDASPEDSRSQTNSEELLDPGLAYSTSRFM